MLDSLPGSNGADILVDLSAIDVPAGAGEQHHVFTFAIPAGRIFPTEGLDILVTYRSKVDGDFAFLSSAVIGGDTAHKLSAGPTEGTIPGALAELGSSCLRISLNNVPFNPDSPTGGVMTQIDARLSVWITGNNWEQAASPVRVDANIAGSLLISLDFGFSPSGGVIEAVRIVKRG